MIAKTEYQTPIEQPHIAIASRLNPEIVHQVQLPIGANPQGVLYGIGKGEIHKIERLLENIALRRQFQRLKHV